MVFFVDPKQFHPAKLFYPKRFIVEIAEEQNLNEPDIQEVASQPDPAMIEAFEKKTSVKELGEPIGDEEDMGVGKLYGQGFRVHGAGMRNSKNEKLRKFISLKL